jgi:hypothetical protein
VQLEGLVVCVFLCIHHLGEELKCNQMDCLEVWADLMR